MWILSGNTNEATDGGVGPEKNFLFFLTSMLTLESDRPEIGLEAWERQSIFDCFGALATPLENVVE